MAQKRMFDKSILETDNFLNISLTAKALYFLLGMEADDEGFVSPKRIIRLYGGELGDLKNLIDSGLVIPFKSGIIVITDWNQNNWLDNRRIRPTQYQTEKKMLILTSQKKYELSNGLATAQLEESSIEENRIEEKSKSRFAPPSLEEVSNYCKERENQINPQAFLDFYSSKGWLIGKNKMKDWHAAVRTWENRDKPVKTDDYFLIVGTHKFKTKEEVESASKNGIIRWDNKERKWIG